MGAGIAHRLPILPKYGGQCGIAESRYYFPIQTKVQTRGAATSSVTGVSGGIPGNRVPNELISRKFDPGHRLEPTAA